jgi:hypothetical protein
MIPTQPHERFSAVLALCRSDPRVLVTANL